MAMVMRAQMKSGSKWVKTHCEGTSIIKGEKSSLKNEGEIGTRSGKRLSVT